MAEYEIESITLPAAQASSNISNWFDILEPVGFTKIYYNDTLQVDRMRWKDTSFGISLNGVQCYPTYFKDDNSVIRLISIGTNLTTVTMNHRFFYRYLRNTNNILFGINSGSGSVPYQKLQVSICEPEDENDKWSIYSNGCYMEPDLNNYINMGNNGTYSNAVPPATAVGLCPFWFMDRFKSKVFHVPVMPRISVGSIFKTMIGDKVYLVNDWYGNSQYNGIAYDITEEFI